MLWLRSILFNIAFYAALIMIMIVCSPALLVGPRWVRGAARAWAHTSIWLLRVICRTRLEVRGLEHIPQGSCLVAAKHQSFLETFVLLTVFPDFAYVLKRELTLIPLFGWYLGGSGQIAIDRSKGRAALQKIVQEARRIIGRGGQIFIFPEGTRRPPGAPPAYRYGVGYIYDDLKVPCVPVALNSGLFWPRRSFLRRPGTVVIDILPPIEPGLPVQALLRLLEDRIETASNRLLAEAVARDASLGAVIGAASAS